MALTFFRVFGYLKESLTMKRCNRCQNDKENEEFYFINKEKNILSRECKECKKKLDNEYYHKNKNNVLTRLKKNRQDAYKWYQEYKKTLKCSECDENHPACLEFHHPDDNKEQEVAKFVSYGIPKLKKEIAKCVVLCANCHRKKHW